MKRTLLLSIAVFVFSLNLVWGAVIPGLYDTGVDNNNNRRDPHTQEIHYGLENHSFAEVFPEGSPYFPDNPQANGAWANPTTNAMWIGHTGGYTTAPDGDYIYYLEFDLTGLDPSTAHITGQWTSDNNSSIWLNGFDTMHYVFDKESSYHYLWSFEISSYFVPGLNRLEFRVTNSPLAEEGTPPGFYNPSGLLVQNLSVTAEIIPEPCTLLLLGLGGLALRRKIRR